MVLYEAIDRVTAPATTWPAARQAYYSHHAACGQCQAARAASTTQQRCPEGLALWDTYNQACDPPQFLWVAPTNIEKSNVPPDRRRKAPHPGRS